jgi:NhaP-type Na+/H+ or K+/H+ antiporter
MLHRLKNKWNVSWLRLFLIICTFALGGSACGYLGRRFLTWLQIEEAWLRIPLYFVLITLLWPFCVLLVSIPLGQFQFFKNYLARLLNRFTNHNKL